MLKGFVIESATHGVYTEINWSKSRNSYGPRFRLLGKRTEGFIFETLEQAVNELLKIKQFKDSNWIRQKWIDRIEIIDLSNGNPVKFHSVNKEITQESQHRDLKAHKLVGNLQFWAVRTNVGEFGFQLEELHNTRIWVNGYPVVITVGDPDDYTKVLLRLTDAMPKELK